MGLKTEMRLNGLTAFQLKIIALVFMMLDHIAAFAFEIPIVNRYSGYLRMTGRLAAPLFLFLLVQSIRHTRSKPKFLLRLYLAGMGAELFVTAMNICLGEVFSYFTPGNIIFTFFYTALYVVLIKSFFRWLRKVAKGGDLHDKTRSIRFQRGNRCGEHPPLVCRRGGMGL